MKRHCTLTERCVPNPSRSRFSLTSCLQELSIYKVLDAHGLHDAAEKDREEHLQVKKAMSYIDSNSVSSLGMDEFANAVEKACQLFIEHAEVSHRHLGLRGCINGL